MSPSIIAYLYLNINFLLGSYGFTHNFYTLPKQLILNETIKNWQFYNIRLIYFNLFNIILIISYYTAYFFKIKTINFFKILFNKINYSKSFIVAFFVIFLFLLLHGFINKTNHFILLKGYSFIPVFLLSTYVIVHISYRRMKWRYIFYILLLISIASFSYNSKREAISLLIPILILELNLYKYNLKLSFKTFSIILVLFLIIGWLVIGMSILRGYGNYKAKNIFIALKYTKDYLSRKESYSYLMNNFEIISTYVHSNNSIEMICKNPNKLTYGSTLLKPVFLFIPRSIWKSKPNSIIDKYTTEYDPEFRSKGGSYPISIQSELFWNFHFGGLLIGFFIMIILNSFYYSLIKKIGDISIYYAVFSIFIYSMFFFLIRGSGFDLFFAQLFIAFIFSFFIYFLFYFINFFKYEKTNY